jgi:hypothetical protein
VEICKKISTECGIFYHPEISIPWCSTRFSHLFLPPLQEESLSFADKIAKLFSF